ncbi:hypothetical protein QQF64_034964 [Cirrhinus molitorella]|uniref:Uncharacterized protein n=1 Tax=Cirrhinus molitorella TaxID=172907 RepID=A0ABR3NEU4_9TELE
MPFVWLPLPSNQRKIFCILFIKVQFPRLESRGYFGGVERASRASRPLVFLGHGAIRLRGDTFLRATLEPTRPVFRRLREPPTVC